MGELASLSKGKTLVGLAEENYARQGCFWHRQGGKLRIVLPLGISGAIASSQDCILPQVTAEPMRGSTGLDSIVNKFTVTGRGGLPPNANDTLQNESMQTNGVITETPRENSKGDNSSANFNCSVPAESNVPKTTALLETQG